MSSRSLNLINNISTAAKRHHHVILYNICWLVRLRWTTRVVLLLCVAIRKWRRLSSQTCLVISSTGLLVLSGEIMVVMATKADIRRRRPLSLFVYAYAIGGRGMGISAAKYLFMLLPCALCYSEENGHLIHGWWLVDIFGEEEGGRTTRQALALLNTHYFTENIKW